VNDGQLDSNTATVSITVQDTAPVAAAQSVSVVANNSLAITLTATDGEHDSLTYSVLSGPAHGTKTSRQRAITRAIKETSHYLGNTPAVCRASYIDPRVIDLYTDGVTIHADLGELGAGAAFGELSTQGAIERAVFRLLSDPRRSGRSPRGAAAAA